ncbi:MAG: type II toxin-antitoxin system PemK/MazF family toxin [Candidatus Peregrinibacteria bacterium]|nr:type II toxin-antitoxin system PemK/MazF family toxin [Candidatus Peregrinibacteria bacterium]
MKKFDDWNQLKIKTEDGQRVNFKNREIWFLRVGKNVGFEQDGKGDIFLRPVVVFKKFNKDVFWGIPCTSQERSGKYYFKISDFNKRKNYLILSQLRLFDAKRLEYKIGNVAKNEFSQIKKNLIELIKEIPEGV